MDTTKIVITLTLFTTLSFTAQAYDAALAESVLNTVTGKMNREYMTAPSGKITVEVTEVLEMLQKHEKIVLLDVRTPEEHNMVAINYPQSIFIPLHELFKKENLDRLPQDGKIIVVCHYYSRAAFATILLQYVGFKNVRLLKGGLIKLVTDVSLKTAPAQ